MHHHYIPSSKLGSNATHLVVIVNVGRNNSFYIECYGLPKLSSLVFVRELGAIENKHDIGMHIPIIS